MSVHATPSPSEDPETEDLGGTREVVRKVPETVQEVDWIFDRTAKNWRIVSPDGRTVAPNTRLEVEQPMSGVIYEEMPNETRGSLYVQFSETSATPNQHPTYVCIFKSLQASACDHVGDRAVNARMEEDMQQNVDLYVSDCPTFGTTPSTEKEVVR
nr:unnamed protein product [Spirometra erinaceieuropaei]